VTVRGFLETVGPLQVHGWAVDDNALDTPVRIAIMLDGEVLGKVVANLPRPDLVRRQIGNGEHGFVCSLNTEVADQDLTRIVACVESSDGAATTLPRWKKNPPAPHPGSTRLPPPAESAAHEQFPLFILGAPRSGTSAVTHALLKWTRYRGHHEGHLLDVLSPLSTTIEEFYRFKYYEWTNLNLQTMIRDVPKAYLEAEIFRVFSTLTAALFPDRYWLDKTPNPEMIRAAPIFCRIWPNARFIFMRRRAFENLESQSRKFARESFRQSCEWWTRCMSAWLEVRDHLQGRALEIDQHFLARSPGSAADAIGDFLELPEEVTRRVASSLTHDRPERTQVDVGAVVDPSASAWGQSHWAIFDEVCRPLFADFGYGPGADYFVSDAPLREWRLI
jgi:hypothetical protein